MADAPPSTTTEPAPSPPDHREIGRKASEVHNLACQAARLLAELRPHLFGLPDDEGGACRLTRHGGVFRPAYRQAWRTIRNKVA